MFGHFYNEGMRKVYTNLIFIGPIYYIFVEKFLDTGNYSNYLRHEIILNNFYKQNTSKK